MSLGLPQDFRFDIFARDRSGPAWRGVESNMQRAGRAASTLMRSLGPLLGLSGGVAVTGFALLARQSLEFADTLVTAADRTSFTVDQLERLRYAGELNRVQFQQTDMAMQRFSRRVAEAANGTGELRSDLERLGISVRDQNGNIRESYDILLDFADAIARTGDGQEQLRLAFKAFDSEGAAFVNVLREGRDGLQRFVEAGEDAEAFLGERLAREASVAARSLREMQMALSGQFNRMVAENADDLVRFADALARIAELGISAASAIGRFYGTLERTRAGELALVPETEAERTAQSQMAERLRDDLSERRAGSQIGSHMVGRLRAVLGRQTLDREGIVVGATGRFTEEQIVRLLQLVNLRLEVLAGARPDFQITGTSASSEDTPPAITPPSGFQPPAGPNKPREYSPPLEPSPSEAEKLQRMEAEFDAAIDAMIAEKAAEFGAEAAKADLEERARLREEFSEEFAWTMANGVRAAFDGDLTEFIQRRLQAAAYNGLYEAFLRIGESIFDRTNGAPSDEGGGSGSFVTAMMERFGFGGNNAYGGSAKGLSVMRVGEKGPEWLAASQDTKVIPNALGSTAPTGPERVYVIVSESEMFEARVEQISAPIATTAAARSGKQAEANVLKKLGNRRYNLGAA